jgi:hypothetical protein
MKVIKGTMIYGGKKVKNKYYIKLRGRDYILPLLKKVEECKYIFTKPYKFCIINKI